MIEASWGLGEAVVAGLVIPDLYRLDTTGRLFERRIGEKDLAVRRSAVNGTEEVSISAARAAQPCLGAAELDALHGLAAACDSVYGPDGHDIEFAFRGGAVSPPTQANHQWLSRREPGPGRGRVSWRRCCPRHSCRSTRR